jgi:hypothetical protein
MQYIDTIDEKRGSGDRCEEEEKAVYNFMQQENLSNR